MNKSSAENASSQFDEDWYRLTYGVFPNINARAHYKEIGIPNLLCPNKFFSPISYLHEHSDIARSRQNPIEHFLIHGVKEGRIASGANSRLESSRNIYSRSAIDFAINFFSFDASDYLERRPDLVSSGVNAKEHYQHYGEKENCAPNKYFDPKFYWEKYKEYLKSWPLSLHEHFLTVGILDGRFPSENLLKSASKHRFKTVIDWLGFWLERTDLKPLPSVYAPSAVHEDLESYKPERLVTSKFSKRKRLNWIIPAFTKGGGGHTTIFRCARTLSRLGWESVFWVEGVSRVSAIDKLYSEYVGYFPITATTFRLLEDGFDRIEDEFIVSSAWTTAYTSLLNKKNNVRLYFVQDRECLFTAAGTEAIKAEYTYKMDFDFICAGPWLSSFLTQKEDKNFFFELCPEPAYTSKNPELSKRDVLATIYIRSHTSRRCSDLMLDVANRLADLNIGEVVVFGDAVLSGDVSPNLTNMGILTPSEMASLFHRSQFGLVASATNYSIVPVEMAAAGMVVCQPYSESSKTTTESHGAISISPDANSIVKYLESKIVSLDRESFDFLRTPYMEFAQSLSWESEFEKLASWLDLKLDPTIIESCAKREKVCIVIPTYYPDHLLKKAILEIKKQKTAYDYQVLVINSVDSRRQCDIVKSLEKDTSIIIKEIPASEFQHGRTRNMPLEIVSADYYVYITQDAVPASEYWLESLVSPLGMPNNCAYSVGAHRAYQDHHPMYDIELLQHFEGIGQLGIVLSRKDFPERYDTEPYFKAAMCFNSDNNAAYRADVLQKYGFPCVNFSEDQAIAKSLLDKGYSRVFSPSSVVYHSHDYVDDLSESQKRGFEEAYSLYDVFRIVRYKTIEDYQYAIRHCEKHFLDLGIMAGLNRTDIAKFIEAKKSYVTGLWQASQKIFEESKVGY